ncbi:MAG: hypothetical protein ACLP19_18190 [Xanthobacteraceae bacterium]
MTENNFRASQRAVLLRYAEHLKSKKTDEAASVATSIEKLVSIIDGYDITMMLVNKYSSVLSPEDRNEIFKVAPIKANGMLDLYTLVRLAGDVDLDCWFAALRDEGQIISRPGVIVPFNRQPSI